MKNEVSINKLKKYQYDDMSIQLPVEFKESMKTILNDEYEEFINSFLENRTNALRVNTLKMGIKDFENLNLFNIDYDCDKVPWSTESYYISNDEYPGRNALHDAGAFYIQEPSAMSVVGETDITKGETILDMCAAPGGKSTYILTKLNNTGVLVSNEIDCQRTKALCENIERFGAINSIVTSTDSKGLLKSFEGYFDKVFIDAPCSGQGMFRKDDYAIKDWSVDKVEECVSIQREIIQDGYLMLKDDGMLIYSTCTFSKEENEDIINEFLEKYPSAKLIGMDRKWPHKEKGEGHFCARILKTSDDGYDFFDDESYDEYDQLNDKLHIDFKKVSKKKSKKSSKKDISSNVNKSDIILCDEFVKASISSDSQFYKNYDISRLYKRGDYVYLSADLCIVKDQINNLNLEKLKILRNGICIGELKKNRFEPSHSLAMALDRGNVNICVDFRYDSSAIKKYISGEAINLDLISEDEVIFNSIYSHIDSDDNKNGSNGWCLISVEGCSIGWAKYSQGILKNKYPKGLRRNIK